MERKKERIYLAGEFAKYFGIKKDTLLYYDKIGLFKPAGVNENGYRYYTTSQITDFGMILALREMNVPIKKLQEYFQAPSTDSFLEITEEQILNIESEIEKLKRIKRGFQNLRDKIIEGEKAEFETLKIIRQKPKKYIYSRQSSEDTKTSTQEWLDIYNEFVKELNGLESVGSVIALEDLKKEQYTRVDRLFLEVGENCNEGEKEYAIYYHRGEDYEEIYKVYEKILILIKKLGYQIAGSAYETYLVTEFTGNKNITVKIEIEVEKNNALVRHRLS